VAEHSCSYFKNVNALKTSRVVSAKEVWDIEEFVKLGREKASCPYYAARQLAEEAEIVFCPYLYLVGMYISLGWLTSS
jgi:Fanconi anemia group J protein